MVALLVTGGAGFMGSHFVRYWLSQHADDKVINLDALTYAGNLATLRDVARDFEGRYQFVKGDIGNFDLVYELLREHRVSILVHFAAESHNNRSIRDPYRFFQTNVVGTQVLLEAARQAGIERFHHVSTPEVYGQLELDAGNRFSGASPLRPNTPYAGSKAGSDLAVRIYQKTFGLPVTISHAANTYGSHQHPEKVFPKFIVSALLGRKLTLYKSSHFRREWIHVVDHASAVESIVLHGVAGEIYEISDLFEADVETIANVVLSTLGLEEFHKSYIPDRLSHDSRYALDPTRLMSELGWRPAYTFAESAPRTVEWYRDNREWWEPLVDKLDAEERMDELKARQVPLAFGEGN